MIGWKTNRKIVVFESDDWGSVRIRSKADYDDMLKKGIDVDRNNFTRFDCLESNQDLEDFFDVLESHKDKNGKPAVYTPMSIVANPNFEKIKADNFQKYHYETIAETYQKYPAHNRAMDLWKEGMKRKVFAPALHGREHLNVSKWMNGLQKNDEGLRLAFEHGSFGIANYNKQRVHDHLAAFDPETENDIEPFFEIISSAGKLFKDAFGESPEHFIASNSPEPKSLEKALKEIGVKYLSRYKLQRYPLGNNKFTREFNWLGKKNKEGQLVLTRNAGFEPSSNKDYDWVDHCLADIKNAFMWGKPAVVSSHRVSFVGFIDPQNSANGLKALNELLTKIKQTWPEVEYMSSMELGETILSSRSN